MHVWDLKYISTSDEEDNDSSENESSSSESDKDKKEEEKTSKKVSSPLKEGKTKQSSSDDEASIDAKKFWKTTPGKNDAVPQIAQKLRPAKKKQRIFYAYTYDNKTEESGATDPKKVKVIKKRVERRHPENLIDMLIMQKQYLYEKEQRIKVLKEQDEDEWSKMT